MILTTSCGNTGKNSDISKSDQALTDSIQQQKSESNLDGDAYIDYDRILYQIVDGDTTEVNTYDKDGRLIVHRYQSEDEEGGECNCTTIYEYDSKGRLVRKKNNNGIDIHYTWNGLTRSDDAFCRSVTTYSDNTYKHKINEKSYISNNGPLAWEIDYDKDGKILEYKSYTNDKLTSASRHEYKDNVETETLIHYNEDGSEKSHEVKFKTDYLPNGKYNKILRTHIINSDKEEIGYENKYDSKNRLVKTGFIDVSYDGAVVTQVDNESGTKTVTRYVKTTDN